jgi:acyl carrier protein
MMKVRGCYMDYEEAESGLTAMPQIKQAAVVLYGLVDQQLAAYVVPEPGCNVDSTELHKSLSSKLPGTNVPDVYIVLDRLPLTDDGEPDRSALGRAVRGNQDSGGPAPQILAGPAAEIGDIWREVLRMEAVGLRDDLFDLGGASLTIVRIASRIRSRMDIDISLTVFYDTPTILGIASAVEHARRNGVT